MILSLLDDIVGPAGSLFFSPNYEQSKVALFDNKIKAKLTELNNFIGDKAFTLGYLTLVDFKIA